MNRAIYTVHCVTCDDALNYDLPSLRSADRNAEPHRRIGHTVEIIKSYPKG